MPVAIARPARHFGGADMVRSLLVRSMLVGAVAGLIAFVVASVWREPRVQAAINFE